MRIAITSPVFEFLAKKINDHIFINHEIFIRNNYRTHKNLAELNGCVKEIVNFY